MDPLKLSAAISALANAAVCKLTPSEIALLASIFVQFGDTLATIAAQKALCEEQVDAT